MKLRRWGMLLAFVLLGMTMLFPLWEITLFAPQYPEGLSLQIWMSKISGEMDNINILNHYIGMAPIVPDSIPELVWMPQILGGMIAMGLLVSFWKSRFLLRVWVVGLFLLGVVGMMDFYKWEYDYGHNLNPDAPIKVPGMHYQPPFIGKKELLNISAYSLPSVSAYLLGLALGLSGYLAFRKEDEYVSK